MYQSDLKHSDQSLEEKLHGLYTLDRNKTIDLSFRPPYLRLLEKLGNPHLKLPPVIHVAGTNGKGSTIAMLRAVLENASYKVHAYTSPHLIEFNERIMLAGKPIENGPLEDLIDEALELNAGGELTFFEITTAIAFAAFARTPADICLLEVGMGGRLDCTNVIETPLITIINAIGLDHTEYLGETIAEIAGEKAGIMKQKMPCVIGQQSYAEAIKVITENAARLNAPLHHASSHEQTYAPALIGPHQKNNMTACLKTLALIQNQFPLTQKNIKAGLNAVRWPARLEKLDAAPFGLNASWELYLDGGHNADAGNALATQAKEWGGNLHIICGMMKGKNTKSFLGPLLSHTASLSFINIEDEPQSQSAEDLQALFPNSNALKNFQHALSHIKQNHAHGRILICGSLYLAGHVLKASAK